MNENELKEKLDELSKGVRLLDTIIGHDWSRDNEEAKFYITVKQHDLIKSLFDFFQSLRWQIALNSYKQLIHAEDDPIQLKGFMNSGCGTPVKVRPCAEEYGNKTYFGILIGDIPLSIGSSIDKDGNLTVKRQMYNPAILIPELKTVVYGCGSWWGEIEKEEDLKELITEDTINNVWYMKLLKSIEEPA